MASILAHFYFISSPFSIYRLRQFQKIRDQAQDHVRHVRHIMHDNICGTAGTETRLFSNVQNGIFRGCSQKKRNKKVTTLETLIQP